MTRILYPYACSNINNLVQQILKLYFHDHQTLSLDQLTQSYCCTSLKVCKIILKVGIAVQYLQNNLYMLATFANKLSNSWCIFTAQPTLSTSCAFQQVRRCYIYFGKLHFTISTYFLVFNDNRAVCIGATKGKILTFTSCIAWKGV